MEMRVERKLGFSPHFACLPSSFLLVGELMRGRLRREARKAVLPGPYGPSMGAGDGKELAKRTLRVVFLFRSGAEMAPSHPARCTAAAIWGRTKSS